MQVAEEDQLSLFLEFSEHLLHRVDDRVEDLRWHLPATIKIATRQATTIVTIDHSIWVEHGNDLENVHFTKDDSLWTVTGDEVQHSFHHPAGNGFTRVNSCSDDDPFLVFMTVLALGFIDTCDHQILTFVASQCAAQGVPGDPVSFSFIHGEVLA